MSERGESETPSDAATCLSCGVPWVNHLGIAQICDAAEDMRDLLREIYNVAQLPADAAPELHHRALVAICHIIGEKTPEMPAAATLGERVVLRLPNTPAQPPR